MIRAEIRRTSVFLAILLVLSGCGSAVIASQGDLSESPTPQLPSVDNSVNEGSEAVEERPEVPDQAQSADLDRVVDGDTLDVQIGGIDERVRLLGMNTPESDECLGDVATQRARELIEGADLQLVVDPLRDDFGRLLAFVYADGVLVNQQLIVDGLAIARDQSGHPYANRFEGAEETARDQGLGVWAADACGEATTAQVSISDYEPNAPGNDAENLNGEWVELRNDGTNPADLGGWVIRDESTRHRYEFPAGFILSAGDRVTLYSGCGTETANERYWCEGDSSVWNNDGDTIFVLDANGSPVTTLPY